MPTLHVEPQSDQHLEDVANALLKARKVVVVTGAGISTNSGIPDFRSENGLYSLIQAQFDAAVSQAPQPESAAVDEWRPNKRRKLWRHASLEPPDTGLGEDEQENFGPQETIYVEPLPPKTTETENGHEAGAGSHLSIGSNNADQLFSTPRPRLAPILTAQLATSPLSSPPADDLIIPPSTLRSHTHKRLVDACVPFSSSPLSSPPPTLFDPFILSSPSDQDSSRRSSNLPLEAGDITPPSISFNSSQTSNSARTALPNMKGRDLFDATIWSDPIRTSVFYTFATSLRQKIKQAEPSTSHRFISHLRDCGKLVRCYTQNIDQIEEKVGLSTCLQDGPGRRRRFTRRSANTYQLGKMAEEVPVVPNEPNMSDKSSQCHDQRANALSRQSHPTPSDGTSTPETEGLTPNGDTGRPSSHPQKPEAPRSGVECVFLHGSLQLLRCFLCGRVCSWDDGEREAETLAGQQPECPHCVGATVAREEKGKRALGVGKLRPDIVLYGEEQPSSHLISPIVTHDLALHPDVLLILGTSLRVHGLKVMVREFAKAVHARGGTVVFVNLTKPPESSWGEVIDYWVQWDCDAWVTDLQSRIPKLWQQPEPPLPKKKRESSGTGEDRPMKEKTRPPPAHPAALRDTKVTGAYWTSKVLRELRRVTGRAPRNSEASASSDVPPGRSTTEAPASSLRKGGKPRLRQPKRSTTSSSTLEPYYDRSKKQTDVQADFSVTSVDNKAALGSILNSVKENPRMRKKAIDRGSSPAPRAPRRSTAAGLKLPPLRSPFMQEPTPPYGRPQSLEPRSPPYGPLASLSPNVRHAEVFSRTDDSLVRLLDSGPYWSPTWRRHDDSPPLRLGNKDAEASAATALESLGAGSPMMRQLMSWGSTWSCKR